MACYQHLKMDQHNSLSFDLEGRKFLFCLFIYGAESENAEQLSVMILTEF